MPVKKKQTKKAIGNAKGRKMVKSNLKSAKKLVKSTTPAKLAKGMVTENRSDLLRTAPGTKAAGKKLRKKIKRTVKKVVKTVSSAAGRSDLLRLSPGVKKARKKKIVAKKKKITVVKPKSKKAVKPPRKKKGKRTSVSFVDPKTYK